MTAKQPAVKKYIVRLSTDERERLNTLIQKGKAPARQRIEGAHPAEGRCLGGRRGLERQPRSPQRWIPASTRSSARASNWWRQACA